ncbi:MAG: type II secretion system F family protein [Candidatus Aenigmarchaeota archaeon]|nr:type II secretion system F family protein [Candidatus Aenigmarchaeota archaeon]
MYEYVSKILPSGIRHSYKSLMRYCEIKTDHDKLIGFVLLFGLELAFGATVGIFSFFAMSFSLLFLAAFLGLSLIFEIVFYAWLLLSADSKAKFTEKVLPDALQLMAMNLKAGMTTDKALLIAARPEFGPLEKELNRAGKQILAGKRINEALLEMSGRIRSPIFERTIRLIVEGIKSGGELSDLLQQTAEDLQNSEVVKGEVQSNVMMYAIFIFFAAGIGAPLLYGISTYLVGVLGTQFAKFQISETMIGSMNMMKGHISISQEFLLIFPITSLIVTSIFGSLIIGLVKGGTEKEGIKFIPMLLIVSLTVFFLVRLMVGGIFAGMG